MRISKTLEDAVLQEWEAAARADGITIPRRILRGCVELFVRTGGDSGDHPDWVAFKAAIGKRLEIAWLERLWALPAREPRA